MCVRVCVCLVILLNEQLLTHIHSTDDCGPTIGPHETLEFGNTINEYI